ncbi:MAG: hypothetical protein IT376_12225 [Polyangiaceae bacterium]|nr:hypothetical protein [Polyangiaceae bacterium]
MSESPASHVEAAGDRVVAAAPPARAGRRAVDLVKRGAPYLVAGAALGTILWQHPPGEIAREVGKGAALAVVPIPLAMVALTLFTVSAADWLVIRASTGPIPYLDVLRAKAGVTILNIVHYAAGQGGYGVWIARRTGVGVGLASGTTLYIVASELTAVCTLASGAIWLGDVESAGALRVIAPAVAGALLLLALTGPLEPFGKHRLTFLAPWRRVRPASMLAQTALRVAQISTSVVGAWWAARAFGMPVPLGVMFTYMPVVLVVASLPVNVAGFGAVQGAWLLLSPWATSGEQVLAFSLVFQLSVAVALVLRGLPFVRRLVREIERGRWPAADGTPGGR